MYAFTRHYKVTCIYGFILCCFGPSLLLFNGNAKLQSALQILRYPVMNITSNKVPYWYFPCHLQCIKGIGMYSRSLF